MVDKWDVGEKKQQLTSQSLDVDLMVKNDGWQTESTSAPWVILVINVNISLVGLILLPSMFQISSTMEWHGLEDVEPLQDAKDKGLAKASSSRLFILYFSDPRSH